MAVHQAIFPLTIIGLSAFELHYAATLVKAGPWSELTEILAIIVFYLTMGDVIIFEATSKVLIRFLDFQDAITMPLSLAKVSAIDVSVDILVKTIAVIEVIDKVSSILISVRFC